MKKGFFKKLWYSITNIEKYGEMAAEGMPRAISYLLKLTLIIAIVFGLGTVYRSDKGIKNTIKTVTDQIENFNYKDGNLDTENQEEIIIDNTQFGKIIINTKTKENEKINSYINSLNNQAGIIMLNDKMIIKSSLTSPVEYKYQDLLKSLKITEFDKQSFIDTINSNKMIVFYISLFLALLLYSFITYLLSILWNVVILSIFGVMATWFAKIKMRYAAIFNMSVYAISLSVLLNIAYMILNIFVDFEIKYFQVMYTAISYIYVISSILIIKSDFIKKQAELTKILSEQEKVKEELAKKEQEKKEEEEKERIRKKDKGEEDSEKKEPNKKEKKDSNLGEQAEGTNA